MPTLASEEITAKDFTIWAGTLASYQGVETALQGIQQHARDHFDEDEDDEAEQSRLLTISNGIGIIQVHGSLTNQDSFWNQFFGITSYGEIQDAIAQALESSEVDKIILDIDSPGGSARGIDNLSAYIKEADKIKSVDAHVSGVAFSAAYWIASAARTISGPRMSESGSIGVIAILQEITGMAEKAGVKFHVFRAGKHKAIGNPYEKLSKESAGIIQSRLEVTEGFFLDAVAENRGIPRASVKARVGEGLTFFAQESVDNGLMDEVLSFDSLFSRLVKARGSASQTPGSASIEDNVMGKKLTPEAEAAIAAGATEEEVLALMAEDESAEDETSEEASTGEEESSEETSEEESSEEEASDETGEEEETSAPAASDNSLVVYLKDEVADLRLKLADAEAKAKKADLLEANEGMARKIIGEYVSGMAVRLGGPALEGVDKMDMSALFSAYTSHRAALVSRFPTEGKAQVHDEEVDEPAAQQTSAEIRSIRANTI